MKNNSDTIGELELKDSGMWDLEWEAWKEDRKTLIDILDEEDD